MRPKSKHILAFVAGLVSTAVVAKALFIPSENRGTYPHPATA